MARANANSFKLRRAQCDHQNCRKRKLEFAVLLLAEFQFTSALAKCEGDSCDRTADLSSL